MAEAAALGPAAAGGARASLRKAPGAAEDRGCSPVKLHNHERDAETLRGVGWEASQPESSRSTAYVSEVSSEVAVSLGVSGWSSAASDDGSRMEIVSMVLDLDRGEYHDVAHLSSAERHAAARQTADGGGQAFASEFSVLPFFNTLGSARPRENVS